MVSVCTTSCLLGFWLVGYINAYTNQDHVVVFCFSAKFQCCTCISWINLFEQFNRSHNFRPSYMRLRASMLRDRLNVGCILAMTATATVTTLNAVMSALAIPQTNLIQKEQLRENLQLSLSLSGNRQV